MSLSEKIPAPFGDKNASGEAPTVGRAKVFHDPPVPRPMGPAPGPVVRIPDEPDFVSAPAFRFSIKDLFYFWIFSSLIQAAIIWFTLYWFGK